MGLTMYSHDDTTYITDWGWEKAKRGNVNITHYFSLFPRIRLNIMAAVVCFTELIECNQLMKLSVCTSSFFGVARCLGRASCNWRGLLRCWLWTTRGLHSICIQLYRDDGLWYIIVPKSFTHLRFTILIFSV